MLPDFQKVIDGNIEKELSDDFSLYASAFAVSLLCKMSKEPKKMFEDIMGNWRKSVQVRMRRQSVITHRNMMVGDREALLKKADDQTKAVETLVRTIFLGL